MEIGDKLKILEKVVHSKTIKNKTTIGIIQQITSHGITIKRIYKGELKNNTSFNIADFKDINKKFYIEKNNKWLQVQIKVTQQNNCELKGGGKYD